MPGGKEICQKEERGRGVEQPRKLRKKVAGNQTQGSGPSKEGSKKKEMVTGTAKPETSKMGRNKAPGKEVLWWYLDILWICILGMLILGMHFGESHEGEGSMMSPVTKRGPSSRREFVQHRVNGCMNETECFRKE